MGVVAFLVAFYLVRKWTLNHFKNPVIPGKNILLVTAHPGKCSQSILLTELDDEAMFFSPFITAATEQGSKVYLVCLSKGIEPGLTRFNEVKEACKVTSTFPTKRSGS
jgi:LmbE family N-acetylglucosaminyl deacetylase